VVDAQCVYVGGTTTSPTYRAISDYTEGVTVTWDTSKASYGDMVDVFTTDASLSGCGGGRQYMTGLWWHTDEQKAIAEAKLDECRKEGHKVGIHTGPVTDVYRAEEYHQRFYAKRNEKQGW
jgi:peptide methionine sulfoxide reductase MsrA